jgi:hypothetical protein
MDLSNLASIGSFVSGIAVVITLIFLLLQMRQANLNQRALMQQMRSARSIDTILRESDRYLCENIALAFNNDTGMDETQILSFVQSMEATLFNWEDSFLQLKAGTIDATSFESDNNALRELSSVPAFRVAWRMNQKYYSSGFREYVDKIMRESKVAQPPKFGSTYRSMMVEEQAAAASRLSSHTISD